MNTLSRLTRAYEFAAQRHVGQRRKGEAAEPYVNHLTEVADLVAQATDGADVEVVIAAVLHDTVEDTDTTFEDIALCFGDRVARIVAEVTDATSLPKLERRRLQVEHAAHASREARIIKLADKTSNLRAMTHSPPKGWAVERRLDYLYWAREVVARCRGASPWLEALFDEAATHLAQTVGLPA